MGGFGIDRYVNFIALKVARNDFKVAMKLPSEGFESPALVVTDYILIQKQLFISRIVSLNRASNFQIHRFFLRQNGKSLLRSSSSPVQ